MKKRLLAGMLVAIMMLSMFPTMVFAVESPKKTSTVIADGTTYTLTEEYVNGTRIVKVIGDGEETTVTLNDEELNIYFNGRCISRSIVELEKEAASYDNLSSAQRITASKTSLYWNYSYYYSDNHFSEYGMYFSLESGNDTGSWSGFDNKNENARDLAYNFCSAVRTLDTDQWKASAASGTAAGSIAAGLAAGGPSMGITTVIGIVVALLPGGVAVAEWIAAYNDSLECNQIFLKFKQAL